MDAIVKGLIGGATVSVLLILAAVVAIRNNFWSDLSTVYICGWLLILTGLTVGQLVLTGVVVSTLTEAPSQTAQATVQ